MCIKMVKLAKTCSSGSTIKPTCLYFRKQETSKKEREMGGLKRMMEEGRVDRGLKVAPHATAPGEEEEGAAEGLAAEVVKAGTSSLQNSKILHKKFFKH